MIIVRALALVCLLTDIQANLEKVLEARGGQFFAGNSLTWAELHFLQLTESLETMSPKVRGKHQPGACIDQNTIKICFLLLVSGRHTQAGESG